MNAPRPRALLPALARPPSHRRPPAHRPAAWVRSRPSRRRRHRPSSPDRPTRRPSIPPSPSASPSGSASTSPSTPPSGRARHRRPPPRPWSSVPTTSSMGRPVSRASCRRSGSCRRRRAWPARPWRRSSTADADPATVRPARRPRIPSGTKLLGISIKNGVATVDLSRRVRVGRWQRLGRPTGSARSSTR